MTSYVERRCIWDGASTQNDVLASLRELACEGIPVSLSCRVLGFSRQGYCPWRVNPVCDREWSDAQVINEIRSIREKDSTFGYRLITDELKDASVVMGENRAHRLCRENRLYSGIIRPKRGSGKTPGPAVHDGLLQRNFTASRVSEKWLLGITEHSTNSGKLYLCAILDCSSRRIVGYSMDSRMKSSLAVNALRHAGNARKPVNFQSFAYWIGVNLVVNSATCTCSRLVELGVDP